ncbi:MAG TPA: hypothetical protein VFU43_22405 [Streptosporangiaceae bacterium]|nr:hypothetical protein [Streptosporangiaceae bacterium]
MSKTYDRSSWFEEFENALGSSDATQALRGTVARILAADNDREQVRLALEEFRVALREQNRESDEDVVLEVLDFLTGWASPHMKIE